MAFESLESLLLTDSLLLLSSEASFWLRIRDEAEVRLGLAELVVEEESGKRIFAVGGTELAAWLAWLA